MNKLDELIIDYLNAVWDKDIARATLDNEAIRDSLRSESLASGAIVTSLMQRNGSKYILRKLAWMK